MPRVYHAEEPTTSVVASRSGKHNRLLTSTYQSNEYVLILIKVIRMLTMFVVHSSRQSAARLGAYQG
jgi:hypothetical protein